MKTRTATLALGAVLAATGVSGPVQAQATPTPTCPIVVSHRTNPKAAPENTVAGINSVPATGAGWVEMDIADSSSGYSVLMHDKTVDRTTNGTGSVGSLSLTYLTSLSATDYAPWNSSNAPPTTGSTKVPYAWDYMNAVRANGLNGILDVQNVQTPDAAQRLLSYMDRWPGLRSRFAYMGNADKLAAMRPYAGDTLKYTLIEYPAAGTMRTAEWLQAQGASAYAIPAKDVTPAKVSYYHSAGIELWTWTSDPGYDTPAMRAQMRLAGVAMLITDYPALAMAECPLPSPSPQPSESERLLQLPE